MTSGYFWSVDLRDITTGTLIFKHEPEGYVDTTNAVVTKDGSWLCVFTTCEGREGWPNAHVAGCISEDQGRSWSKPVAATYSPGGRRIKHNRACPRLWKTNNGKYLFWFNNHATKSFTTRNPVWITGGFEKDGFIHWSQPEILLYGPVIKPGISYPDLIQEDGGTTL